MRAAPPLSLLGNEMYCGEQTIVKRQEGTVTGVSLRCRAWTCPDCAPKRKRQLMAEGCGGQPNTFLTLTSRRIAGQTPAAAARLLSRSWRLLRLRMMRLLKTRKLPFLCVFEQTQAGWPHLHIMARMPYVDQAWISAQMAQLMDSPVVWIERITNVGKMVAYVSKYCSKDCHKFSTCKRYWQSQDFDLREQPPERPAPPPGEGWEQDNVPLRQWIERWRTFGYRVEIVSGWKAVAYPPSESS